ncbi:solute carrier family 22 member 7-like [Oratosquilla oratoria]|uniref:solute carrier family 22 member 7-like n=1 Tax=Oratosquilla oratoria TaxID=337810 RepID=UPI003F764CC5
MSAKDPESAHYVKCALEPSGTQEDNKSQKDNSTQEGQCTSDIEKSHLALSSHPQSCDDIINQLGLGRWQIAHLIALSIAIIHSGPLLVMTNFQNAPVRFRCAHGSFPGENSSLTGNLSRSFNNVCPLELPNLLQEFDKSSGVSEAGLPGPQGDGGASGGAAKSKAMGVGVDDRGRTMEVGGVPCSALEYDTSEYTLTFTTEFDLICTRSYLRPLFQMLFAAGYATGDIIGGLLTDRFGRRISFCIGSSLSLTSNILLFLSPNVVTSLVLRYVMGTACTMTGIPSSTAVTENVPGKHRANSVVIFMGLPNCLGIIIYSTVAYFVRDWRFLQLALIFPALGYIPLLYFFDESPRWLALHSRHNEALAVLRRATRLNGVKLPPESQVIKALENTRENARVKYCDAETTETRVSKLSCMETLRIFLGSPVMRRISIMTPTIWFLHCLFYIGIPLNAHNNDGSPFLYLALTGLADFASPLLGLGLGNRLGRVKFLIILSILSAINSLLCLVLKGHFWIQWLFMILAMAFIATAYLIHYTYVAELNPTCVRGQGTALCAFVGHCSYILAPYVTDVLTSVHNLIPNVVFGVCGLVAACLLPFLPETKDLPLCDTAEDVERRSKKKMISRTPEKDSAPKEAKKAFWEE